MFNTQSSRRALTLFVSLVAMFSLFSTAVGAAPSAAPANPVTFTILQTNDFHGQLEAANPDPNKISTPGMARTAKVINDIRTAKGADNVLLVDAGDEMQGSLLSNLGDGTQQGRGIPTIATFNAMGYNVATFGNHEFDWGQTVLGNRTTQAVYPFVTANIVVNNTGNCSTAGWTTPSFADAPYVIKTIGTAPDQVKVAFIGVTTTETPTITIATATAGLCFKDPTTSILNYYDQMKTDGADVIVVLSHLGYPDGGYGYGLPVYGDQTLAKNLINAGKPVNLIIGGHSHTSVNAPGTTITVSGKTGSTLVTQAAYNGRRVGQADITVGADDSVSISWKVTVWTQQNTSAIPPIPASVWRTYTSSSAFTEITDVSKDPAIDSLITSYANDPGYLSLVNTPVGYSAVDLGRNGSTVDNMMATFIDDAIYNYLNTDSEGTNDVDIFFNNAGGIRTDWCYVGGVWQTSGCTTSGLHDVGLLNYGNMFTVLPFGNATVVGQMTGANILEVLNQAPLVSNGVIQVAGLKYKYYKYTDTLAPGNAASPYPYAWGAYDVTVYDKASASWKPLDLSATYNVGTNEFLAPAGGDGYSGFKYMTNISYWGDMLNAVDAYVNATYTDVHPYKGPNGDGTLDGRIGLNGNGDSTYDAGVDEIIPLTILHHNDSHGNLYKNGTYAGLTQLATLIKQEELHNPGRTLLFTAGDNIQGDGMSFYFKSSYTGFAVDGTDLKSPPQTVDLTTDPIIAVMNLLGYDAMTLGNHEFNFGSDVFKGVLGQTNFPILDADVTDGAGGNTYGLAAANHGAGVKPYIEKTLGAENIKVGIMGLGNPRIPNYELPSNILGLTFANQLLGNNPITRAQDISNTLHANNDDVVLALTHLGFTDPTDPWVDTYLAAHTTGIDAIIGGHSHTDPTNTVAYPYLGTFKYLPSIVPAANGKPVVINQAYRYNYFLGEVILGLRAKTAGGYEVVSQTGRNLAVCAGGKTGTGLTCSSDTAEDATIKALIDPYKAVFTTYNTKVVGVTNGPIDALQAFTQETTGANMQADAAVYELSVKRPEVRVDFHLSGAMTNKAVTGTYPLTLKVSDMFTLMPYENSLVVLSMNGPQLKTVLERAYFNYWNYKYTSPITISYYTTCMLDTNSGNQITYNDKGKTVMPDGNNVVSLNIGGKFVDFNDASTYYNVSTVNYLAAGSCNFSDAPGTSLWPLNQTVADTQYYVRDAVIDYIHAKSPVSPAIEGRLVFITDNAPPTIAKTLGTPAYTSGPNTYVTSATTLTVNVSDPVSGLGSCSISIAGPGGTTNPACAAGDNVLTLSGADGAYTLTVNAVDKAGNASPTFTETDILDNTSPLLTKTIGDPVFVKGTTTFVKSTTQIGVAFNDGTGSGVAACTLKVDAGSMDPYTGAKFSLPVPDGPHTLSVACTDNLGNSTALNETDTVDDTAPVIGIDSPKANQPYLHPDFLKLDFEAKDALSGLLSLGAKLDGKTVLDGQRIDLYTLSLGNHTLTLIAVDKLGNTSSKSVTFGVTATVHSLMDSVNRFVAEGKIDPKHCDYRGRDHDNRSCIQKKLLDELQEAQSALNKGKTKTAIQALNEFIEIVKSQSGKQITSTAAKLLIDDAKWVIAHPK